MINLECEYLVQRVELSFLQQNLNAAEFMCNNAMERFARDESAASRLQPRIRESLGKTLYRIGKDLVKHANLTGGVEWLARAMEVVDPKHVGSDQFATELRFGVMQHLVQASLKTQMPVNLERARDALEMMTNEWPERLNVHCLGLDIIVAQGLGTELYHASLIKMMTGNVALKIETGGNRILGKCHVLMAQDLQGRGHRFACNVIDRFVTERLIQEDNQSWIEQAFITRVWMMVQDAHLDEEVVQSLHDLCEGLEALFCETKKCLEKICNGANDDLSILYACALEAQSAGSKDIILQVLNQLLGKLDFVAPPDGAHLPAIYRTMIRLILSDIHDNKAVPGKNLAILYNVFGKALNNAIKFKSLDVSAEMAVKSQWSTDEYDWFSRNTYNLSLRALQHWPVQYILQFAQLCVQFIELYPAETCSEEDQENLALRRSFCEYICASTCIALARKEDKMDEQVRLYGAAQKSITSFRNLRAMLQPRLAEKAQKDFGERYLSLLSHEFEACAHLEEWDSLPRIVDEVGTFKHVQPLRRLGDMILCVDAPVQVSLSVLENVINHSIQIENYETDKIARWIRVLLQRSLQGDFNRAERLVHQVLDICKQRISASQYPQDELEWVAATLWNLAIDKNCAGDYNDSKRWAEFALSVAGLLKDGGKLEALLHAKFGNLRTS
ncbi:hypothetical protein H072_6544 [Dactylellina haptotyla CBS 200.50]|uniref:Protein ZIP4 homolog n=1 Tax=Dactylellina haptotyla (strain CBS 200.50) TaxID=1284197 RepID=S8BJZ6_DACHA|nr:hypothetical protein H072_6544 [Dactylellina haptotyla CBS 200.50]